MSNVKINISGGTVLITALLCILKLTGILTISWWWCFCLFWLPLAVLFIFLGMAIVFIVLFLFIACIIEICKEQ